MKRYGLVLAGALLALPACGGGSGSAKLVGTPSAGGSAGTGGTGGTGGTDGGSGGSGDTGGTGGSGGTAGKGGRASGGSSGSGGSSSGGMAGGTSTGGGPGYAGYANMADGGLISPPPPPCPEDGPCLQWENVSPPVDYAYEDQKNYGFQTVDGAKADALTTLYVGTCNKGVWKTTDGANTWTKVNTGTFYNNDGTVYAEPPYSGVLNPLDAGRNWTMAVDPTNSDIVYTTAGYGVSQSLWKSTNGGVDWTEMLGEVGRMTSAVVYTIAINPLDPLHLLLTMVSWQGYDSDAGIQESRDGGTTWTPRPPTGKPGDTPSGWGHGQYVFFVGQGDDGKPDVDGNYWLVTTQNDGVWRTTDGSQSWTRVGEFEMTHGQESMYRAPSTNALYLGGVGDVYRSLDNGQTWSPTGAQSGQDGYGGLIGDGARIWAMLSNTGVSTGGPYRWQLLPENDTTSSPGASSWSFYNEQEFQTGPMSMVYDSTNHVLYASMWSTGFWRLRLE
jgi:hypothetical protein